MVFSRNAVHSALWLVNTMLAFGVFYVVQEAPFLGAVQIIVYTGAIMILFLFVLMLVGRDSSDSVVETLRGQRVAATVLGVGFAALVGAGIAGATQDIPVIGLDGRAGGRGQHPGDRRAAVHQVPARLRGDQRSADHRRGRRDGAGAHRAGARQPAQPEGAVPRPVPQRPPGDPARPRCLRAGQLRRRPGDPARRHGRSAGQPRDRHRAPGARPDGPSHRPRAARLARRERSARSTPHH